MAKIFLADGRYFEELEKAAEHLCRDGHQVEVFQDGQKLLAALEFEPPDVLALSFFLHHRDGFEIIIRQSARTDFANIQFIWITMMDALVPQTLMRSWVHERIHSYLVAPYHYGQVVASVEQALYRQFSIPLETLIQLRLDILATYLSWYMNEHKGVLPVMKDWKAFQSELNADHRIPEIYFQHPDPNRFFYPNASLSKIKWSKIKEPDKTFIFAEGGSMTDGTRWAVFFKDRSGYPRPYSDCPQPHVIRIPVEA